MPHELILGAIYGLDAEVVIRAGGLMRVPAHVVLGRVADARGAMCVSVKLALDEPGDR